jgi:hypothetical protein
MTYVRLRRNVLRLHQDYAPEPWAELYPSKILLTSNYIHLRYN